MKRLTCALLALTLCLTMAACGGKTESKGTITEGLCYEATGISPDEAVVTVDGVEIPMDIYYYFLVESTIYAEQFLSYYGMELDWEMKFSGENTVADVVREEAYLNAVQLATIETLVDKYDIALDEAVRRVSYMERLMDEVLAAQKDESRTWPWFRMRQLRILEDYYENGLWRLDFETDERGLLPRGLKRGVLSEDGLYNVLTDAWEERKACQRKKQEQM
jgi:hypothetical protein